MNEVLVLRILLTGWIALGLIINGIELRAIHAIVWRFKHTNPPTNGQRLSSANERLSGARYRFFYSCCLCGSLTIFYLAPPPPREVVGFAILSRLIALSMAVAVTAHGFSARRGRLTTTALIAAEDAEAS